MVDEKRIWQLMAKKLSGESTQEELAELETILKWNPEAGNYMDVLSNWWRMAEKMGPVSGLAFDSLLKRLEKSEEVIKRKSITEKIATFIMRFCNGNFLQRWRFLT